MHVINIEIKFQKTTNFDNSNYHEFEENLLVPDTLNNRGLTVSNMLYIFYFILIAYMPFSVSY